MTVRKKGDNLMNKKLQLNAGTGMALGVITAALISILINAITSSSDIWAWAIPVGIASGLAIGAGATASKPKE
jgi:hypothetical protein